MKKDVKEILQKELKKNGKKGGTVTRDRYGSEHFSKLGKKGGRARKKKSELTK